MSNLRLVTTAEAAQLLSCSHATVARLAASGTLSTAQRLPGKTGALLFNESDVRALAKKRAEEARAKVEAAERRLSEVSS